MSLNPGYILRRLLEAVPQPKRIGRRALHANEPVNAIGCCPACHEFVQVDPFGPSERSICPSCGRLIRSLDPLGSAKSLGATDEL